MFFFFKNKKFVPSKDNIVTSCFQVKKKKAMVFVDTTLRNPSRDLLFMSQTNTKAVDDLIVSRTV